MPVRTRFPALLLTCAVLVGLSACGAGPGPDQGRTPPGHGAPHLRRGAVAGSDARPPAPRLPQEPPHLGPRTLARVPAASRQVVEVVGDGRDSSHAAVTVHVRTSDGWQAGETWPARNAQRGWSDHHRAGDLHSPIGVFTLSDAGGLLPDPGTRLPYDHSTGFSVGGRGLQGEPLAGSFDYVVAIDYNRRTGVTPLDHTRPRGVGAGGGIWFHVDHGGPTHGCVGLSRDHMRSLLRTLDPALHPVVVMGDAASLAR